MKPGRAWDVCVCARDRGLSLSRCIHMHMPPLRAYNVCLSWGGSNIIRAAGEPPLPIIMAFPHTT